MPSLRKVTVFLFVAGALFAIRFAYWPDLHAQEQPSWQWPERAENLQSLPEDFPPERLRAVMTGFTRALGVRCSHCHVGQEGEPLDTYDFASDDNPKKQIARDMLAMLGAVNDHLEEMDLEGEERVNMWCHTCHRGRPLPKQLPEELGLVYREGGIDSVMHRYRALRERFYGRGAYDFGERSLRELGHALLAKPDLEAAVAVFRLNVEHFPESSSAHVDLAGAQRAAGDDEHARESLERAVALDPSNEVAKRMLEELRSN